MLPTKRHLHFVNKFQGTQRFVSTTGTNAGDCTTACATLGYALQSSGSGDVISVASGTYTGSGFRELVVPSGVTIKGAGIDSTIIDLANLGMRFVD